MFRDPACYRTLRKDVIPVLKTYPFIKVWHAGCATGEEVYSMAILLKEEGLYDRCQIYATDFNQAVLRQAQDGIYPAQAIREYTANYQRAGGTGHFSDYYTADYGSVILDRSLKDRIVFAEHNLVTDSVFGDMHLIMCRNVLIYFNRALQNQVIGLFHKSLCPGGFLCLGSKETLRFTDYVRSLEVVSAHDRIFRKPLQPTAAPSARPPS
jgi:chemotaxis protein methyltransferase CheR